MILKTDLYEHQTKAYEKLKGIKVGALYMEMGTGKTRTALELIAKRYNEGKVNHVLWLCPCSVKENLRRDLIKHLENIDMITICGIETLSSSIRANSALLNLVQEKEVFLIVDESNLVKNFKVKRTQNTIRLSQYCTYKLILNGTPLSRNEQDLFSQWYILDWRILGYQSYWSFSANHLEYDSRIKDRVIRCLNTDYLIKKIAPYSYQIKKSECLNLPPKTYERFYFSLTPEQEEHYQEVGYALLDVLDDYKPETIYRFLTGLQNVVCGFRINVHGHMTREPFFETPLDNPRIQLLLSLVEELGEEKAIIFCKYTPEIVSIAEILNKKHGEGTAVTIHGGIPQKQRNKNIDAFSKDTQFLVANKTCAGYGLNLQFCSYVIYYSNDWDFATRQQSEDRVHRMGQTENVHIMDICASYTIDEMILRCLSNKEYLVNKFKTGLDGQKDRKEYLTNFIKLRKDLVE